MIVVVLEPLALGCLAFLCCMKLCTDLGKKPKQNLFCIHKQLQTTAFDFHKEQLDAVRDFCLLLVPLSCTKAVQTKRGKPVS